jgi:hypothetical protein
MRVLGNEGGVGEGWRVTGCSYLKGGIFITKFDLKLYF